MKMSELIAAVGDDNVMFQKLNNDFTNIDIKHSKATISFACDRSDALGLGGGLGGGRESTRVGLVIWFDQEHLDRVLEGGSHE